MPTGFKESDYQPRIYLDMRDKFYVVGGIAVLMTLLILGWNLCKVVM
jgi:hypothetical protein